MLKIRLAYLTPITQFSLRLLPIFKTTPSDDVELVEYARDAEERARRRSDLLTRIALKVMIIPRSYRIRAPLRLARRVDSNPRIHSTTHERNAMSTDRDDSLNAQSDANTPSRDELCLDYLDSLPYTPYPFQEKAIEEWFESSQGVLVCAPTGMGKTLVAEAGVYEALRTGKRVYYTTPLIALTEQKYAELQRSAERWGFDRSDVGLITGNRRENVDAKVLVVVAEILFNRLLASNVFDQFAKQNESVAIEAERKLSQPQPRENAETKITAASLNEKRSVAVTLEDPKLKNEPQDSKIVPNIPQIPIDQSDFEDDPDYDPATAHFSFDNVAVVVMDEFHQFADPERGVVWEFTLGLLPAHIRTLLISATVGNAVEFVSWLRTTAGRSLRLVQSDERKVPLVYNWVDDKLLPELLEDMCKGNDDERLVPALVFRFNRDECWDDADVIKGKNVVDSERQKIIAEELKNYDLSQGAGPKLRQLFLRGIGVHHAGVLPKYRRIVEDLFQKKLLSYCVCTETLAAGINLPARSVVLPSLMKGPAGDKKLVDASSAQQIFGRAGRPQYDSQGYVFALAHEDDVKYARAKQKYDQIPENSKDPKIREAKKKAKKKLPTRNPNEQYWTRAQFERLYQASAGSLSSRGPLPWRLLAHMIERNSDVRPIRALVARRLMTPKRLDVMQRSLDKMLLTLWRGGFIRLAPNPERYGIPATAAAQAALAERRRDLKEKERRRRPFGAGIFDDSELSDPAGSAQFDPQTFAETQKKLVDGEKNDAFDFFNGPDLFNLDNPENVAELKTESDLDANVEKSGENDGKLEALTDEMRDMLASSYRALRAYPTEKLKTLTMLRGVNPVYGSFLLELLGEADRAERVQAFESLLEMPQTVARRVRVPKPDELPAGKLATEKLDKELLQSGLATLRELVPPTEEEEIEERENRRRFGGYLEERTYVIPFAEKLRRLFDYKFPGVALRVTPVWCAGELLFDYQGDFNKYILSKSLQKQEGVVFRHLLRLILLVEEFLQFEPVGIEPGAWRAELNEIAAALVACCRKVDPSSVEETLRFSQKPDLLEKT